jgi:hypothetical protein
MLEGFKALLGSEKAIAGGILIICATVLVALNKMTVSDWQTYSQTVFITYVAGKTVQGAVATVANRDTTTTKKTEVTVSGDDTKVVDVAQTQGASSETK